MTALESEIELEPAALEALSRLRRDVRATAALIDRDQARGLVNLYYEMQAHRIALDGQARSLDKDEKPHDVVDHFGDQMRTLERQMVTVLDVFSMASAPGRWARTVKGVGPVIAAGLLAHIDIERAPTVGHIWSFAGLNPTVQWKKGEKRPWNADLKVLCWKLGDSFVKVSGRDDAFYGLIYRERKVREVERNDLGLFADQAARSLETKKISDKELKATYEAGRLPAGRLDLRARRYAVKLFLSHLHHVMYEDHYGEAPPKPYILTEAGGHAHFIAPPNWP